MPTLVTPSLLCGDQHRRVRILRGPVTPGGLRLEGDVPGPVRLLQPRDQAAVPMNHPEAHLTKLDGPVREREDAELLLHLVLPVLIVDIFRQEFHRVPPRHLDTPILQPPYDLARSELP